MVGQVLNQQTNKISSAQEIKSKYILRMIDDIGTLGSHLEENIKLQSIFHIRNQTKVKWFKDFNMKQKSQKTH